MLKDSTVNAFCATVYHALKRERLRQNLSMNALAERAGLSQQMVSYVERGLRKPTLDTLFRMSCALDVELGSLLAPAVKNARRGKKK